MSESSSFNARFAFLGPNIEHRHSLSAMLGRGVDDVPWMPDLMTFLKSRNERLPRWLRLCDQLSGTRHADYLRLVTEIIDRERTQVLISFWGTTPLPDLIAIRKQRPAVKIVFMVLCHPLAGDCVGIARQNFFMRRAARSFDAVLFPSDEMNDYFRSHIFNGHAVETAVIPPCWPASFQCATQAPSVSNAPNLIYTGRTDFNQPSAEATDDIRPLMRELLDIGIELHHSSTPVSEDGHPKRKTFEPVPLTQLIARIGGYDASLIAYDTDAASCDERYQFTVFDRLITSVAAGVPIAIPRKGYAASKQYLNGYPTIEFDSAASLHESLSNRADVQRMREAAWKARGNYSAEKHTALLTRFLDKLV